LTRVDLVLDQDDDSFGIHPHVNGIDLRPYRPVQLGQLWRLIRTGELKEVGPAISWSLEARSAPV
jgi:hypothetical protein